MTVSFLSDDWRTSPPSLQHDSGSPADCQNPPTDEAGKAPTSTDADAQHEEAIAAAGRELEAAQALYEASGCFGDAAARDMARDRFYALLRARSAAQVAKLEKERGLA